MEVEEPADDPLPEDSTPLCDLTLDEIPLDNLAYIRFRQAKDTRKEIPAYELVAVYHDLALQMDIDMPAIPAAGVGLGVGKYGPWDLYMHFTLAKAFADLHHRLVVCGSGILVSVVLAMDRDRIPLNIHTMGISITPFLTEEGGFMDVQYPPGAAFKLVHKKDIINTLKKHGIAVYRGARLQVKTPGEEGEPDIPMGTGLMTDRLNLTIKPMYESFAKYPWPPTILHRHEETGMEFIFPYRLGGKNAETLHSGYDGCKGPKAWCQPNCSISGHVPKAPGNDEGTSKRKQAEVDARVRKARGKQGIESFLASRTRKSEVQCQHMSAGKCKAGTKCGFMHVGGNEQRDGRYNPTWEAIQCAHDKRASGWWCTSAPNCIYHPCAMRQREAKDIEENDANGDVRRADSDIRKVEKRQRAQGNPPPHQ
jgi:hypothetical protein